jgi:hypothetical protein
LLPSPPVTVKLAGALINTNWFEGLQTTAEEVGFVTTVTVVAVPPVTLFVQATSPVALEQLIPNSVVAESAGDVQLPLSPL